MADNSSYYYTRPPATGSLYDQEPTDEVWTESVTEVRNFRYYPPPSTGGPFRIGSSPKRSRDDVGTLCYTMTISLCKDGKAVKTVDIPWPDQPRGHTKVSREAALDCLTKLGRASSNPYFDGLVTEEAARRALREIKKWKA